MRSSSGNGTTPSKYRSNIHMIIRPTCLSGSFRDSILFTEVCHSSSDETRWNSLLVVEYLHTFNITVEAISIIEMNNSILNKFNMLGFKGRRHVKSHIFP